MDDLDALAWALGAELSGVRAGLIVSRDGLVLGAYPADGEALAKPAWMRLSTLGEPERGFVQFATETWCWEHRGHYTAFVMVEPGVRPGLVLDAMERILQAAEEARASAPPVRRRPQPAAPSSAPASEVPASARSETSRPQKRLVEVDDDLSSDTGVPVPEVTRAAAPPIAEPSEPEVASLRLAEPAEPEAGRPQREERDEGGRGAFEAERRRLAEVLMADADPEPVAEPLGGLTPDDVEGSRVWAIHDDADEDEGVDTYSLTKELGRLLQGEGGGADG